MTDRYELQIGERSMPNAMAKHTPVSDGGMAAAIGGLGQGFDKLAAVALRKQEETDMYRVEEANTELTKGLLDYMNNPDTGILHTRKMKGAIWENSVTAEFETRSKEILEGVAKDMKLNSRQIDAFRRVALRTAMRKASI